MKKLILSAAAAAALFASTGSFAQTPGVLLVNEFSKGTGNVGPYIELLVGSTSATKNVDVRNWIVDDNNGVFSTTAPGNGITTGHLRLVNDGFWSSVPAGTLILMFNNATGQKPAAAGLPNLASINAASAAADGTFTSGGTIYVAVGKSPYVAYINNIPNVGVFPYNGSYCGSTSALVAPGLFSTVDLATDLTGDGVQTRCPGCLDNLQSEPSFYSGAAYGSLMNAVTGSGIGGAKVTTNPAYTTFAGKVFSLTAGSASNAPGVSANWSADTATIATQTPGSQNNAANGAFIASVAGTGTGFRYTACAQPDPMTEPKGALVVTEISNGPSGECEYVVLAVAACSSSNDAENVDVRGWILDDNNGAFNPAGAGTGRGITTGHFRLPFSAKWAAVPVGSSIVVYNGAFNCIGLPTGTATLGGHNVYYIDVNNPGTNTDIERYGSFPTSANGNYCNPNGLTTPYVNPATSYAATVGLGNTGDGFQVRCPGCNTMNAAGPDFYHGIGYGTDVGANAFASAAGLIGGPVKTFSSLTGQRILFKFTGSISSSSVLANPANFDTAAALTSPATVGDYSAALFAYLTSGAGDFPCCGAAQARPAVQQESAKAILNATDVKVYPNPAKAVLNIEFPAAQEVAVKLFDMNGRIVANQNANGKNKVSINVAGFTPGLYFYQVISNGAVQSGKVTVGK
ncbi:T9SS type A sorting domain-containing protein [Taibaiella koreensis]|uniref:T9SS type A sorting domain-containing protein n=1 Tax=Taibaiella koreensis TaxID=1268548 RepID=UPI000E599D13|nr:T9SS type A sorting domain-containing protein [Taibaiella koreensis]